MCARRQVFQKSAAPTVSSTQGMPPSEYLTQNWFPINGVVFAEIKLQLASGKFTDNRRALINELKKDFALLTYCLRELRGSELFDANPLKILEVVPLEEIEKIFATSESDISTHSMRDMLKPQALRFKHSLISSSTAELLAESSGMDPQAVFGAAVIRQTGLNLIAWNYPRVYTKALTAVAAGQGELESILLKSLGFSPAHIGIGLTMGGHGVSPEGLAALGLGEESTGKNAEISRMCQLAEAFAQANDPETFPTITRKWQTVMDQITTYLGPKGLHLLRERIERNSIGYMGLAQKGVDTELSFEKNLEIANRKVAETLIVSNVEAQKVDEEVQKLLKRVYGRMHPGHVSPDALQLFVTETLPAAGFKQGCVYLFDERQQALVPRLRIGARPLEHYKALPFSAIVNGDNPILEAYQSSFPIKREGTVMFGDRVSLIAGVIGIGDKSGVLYLEVEDVTDTELSHEPVVKFKALKNCLADCLNLNSKQT